MDNIAQHISNQPSYTAVSIIAVALVLISVPYFINQSKRYGSLLEFASKPRKLITGSACLAVVGMVIYGLTPYVAPPTNEIAIVLGNTQNTPMPKITESIANEIIATMLQHKGDNVNAMADSIKIIPAAKHPKAIALDATELKLRPIGNNSSNAKRNAELNIKAIEAKLNALTPTDNGASYLEGILEAHDNVKPKSKIIVIGSGLSDSGDLNFSKTNILTNESNRTNTVDSIKSKYGRGYLDNYSVEFFGLGDTTKPQEPLSNKQKGIVRDTYRQTIQGLGGNVQTNTETLAGSDSIKTNYIVGTTDTGCGDIGLVFDDDNLKFIPNQAAFIDQSAAKTSLTTIKTTWDKYSDAIQSIQIDGYIAHYSGFDNLSQQRADSVKKVLIDLGIPAEKIAATGRGFGPYQIDTQNRMVKVTISRNSDICQN